VSPPLHLAQPARGKKEAGCVLTTCSTSTHDKRTTGLCVCDGGV
jgi:hypothetical protein